MEELRQSPAMEEDTPVMVAGDPEKRYFIERVKNGIPLTGKEYESLEFAAKEYGVAFDCLMQKAGSAK